MKYLLFVGVLISASFLNAAEKSRTWTDANGKHIQAKLVGVRGERVVLRQGSKDRVVSIATLSMDDQQYITENPLTSSATPTTPTTPITNSAPVYRKLDKRRGNCIIPATGPSGFPVLCDDLFFKLVERQKVFGNATCKGPLPDRVILGETPSR